VPRRQAAYEHTQTTAAATLAGEYVDLSHLPRLINSDGNVMAALSIAVYAKLFKQLASVRGVEHIVRVIKKAMAEVVPFLLLWSVLYMGFGLAFYSLFGGQVYHVRPARPAPRAPRPAPPPPSRRDAGGGSGACSIATSPRRS
jgi:hypothetical protein